MTMSDATRTTSRPCGACLTGRYEVTIPAALDAGQTLEALYAADDAHRETHAGDPVHIRRQIARTRTRSTTNPLTDLAAFRLGSEHDGSKTLCGAAAGSDMSWSDTRFASGLAHVTCEDCKRLRTAGEGTR
jgi:hypothetical protein